MKAPAFQFYPADFLADENVELMNNRETGCYIRLLCRCWIEGSIPADINKIAKLCQEDSSAMAELWLAISPCFAEAEGKPGRLVNRRLEEERWKQEKHRTERASAGAKGAKTRWDKEHRVIAQPKLSHGSANGSAMAQPMANDSSSSSSSSSLVLTQQQEKEQAGESAWARLRRWLAENCHPAFVDPKIEHRWLPYLQEMGQEVIELACTEAASQGQAERPSYVFSILAAWQTRKVRGSDDVQRVMAEHKARPRLASRSADRKSNVILKGEPKPAGYWDHPNPIDPGNKPP